MDYEENAGEQREGECGRVHWIHFRMQTRLVLIENNSLDVCFSI